MKQTDIFGNEYPASVTSNNVASTLPVYPINPLNAFDDLTFDSDEEYWFNEYLRELDKHGFIDQVIFHPESYELTSAVTYNWTKTKRLKTKTNVTQEVSTLLNPHKYTIDWIIFWSEKAKGLFYKDIYNVGNDNNLFFFANEGVSYIDVKGSFAGRNNTSAITFPLNQKWMHSIYGIFVQKIIPYGKKPNNLFTATFTPQSYILRTHKTTGKPLVINWRVKTISEFVSSKQIK